jgi:hypothetical protein
VHKDLEALKEMIRFQVLVELQVLKDR